MKKIVKRLLAVLCVCTTLFSVSGCISTASIDDAKSLSSNSKYNIEKYEEESVKIDLDTGMSFSEKGSVRFENEGGAVELVDFLEYGGSKSDTVYFNGLDQDGLEDSYFYSSAIECAFEYKNMIYFLRRTYDKQKVKYNRTLYRTTLKGEDLTKITTITQTNAKIDDNWYDADYSLGDVYVQNNTMVFRIYYCAYSNYDDESADEVSDIYKIDLKTGISQKLLEREKGVWISSVKCDNDFTYLYLNYYSYRNINPKVYKIDNNTNESSTIKYKWGRTPKSEIYAVYNDMLICKDVYSGIYLVSTDNKPKIIYNGNYGEIDYVCLLDNNVLIKCNNSYFYSYNLETGKNKSYEDLSSDISHAVYKLGDKYLCFINDADLRKYYDISDIMSGEYGYECYYWSSIKDVETNKHNFREIGNQRIINDYYLYPYAYDNYDYSEEDYEYDDDLYQ